MKKTSLITILLLTVTMSVSGNYGSSQDDCSLCRPDAFDNLQDYPKPQAKPVYVCPMHAKVVKDKPGKCPECGMSLVMKEAAKEQYTCPMHPKVVQDTPGKCPDCGMNLVRKEAAKVQYTCPMHPEVISDKADKCPKCGMNLVKKAPDSNSTTVKK